MNFNNKPIGIRLKIILIFVFLKVLPLIILSYTTIYYVKLMETKVENSFNKMIDQITLSIHDINKIAIDDSIDALNKKSQQHIENITTLTAHSIAKFLYERDNDILSLANIVKKYKSIDSFINKKRSITSYKNWEYDDSSDSWKLSIPVDNDQFSKTISCYNNENKKKFHYNSFKSNNLAKTNIPLYLEITFIDTDGIEIEKKTTSNITTSKLKNVSDKRNTFCKAEDYFKIVKNLKEGEIYVTDVIGEYVGSKLIGYYNKKKCKEINIPFEPTKSAYAGYENPVGKRFRGLIRWITPVFVGRKKIGYVTLALDHTHIMEFTDHISPSDSMFIQTSDASTGNYAFMWDYKGRCISHPRDYFIVGYDKNTGSQQVPWLDEITYNKWEKSNKTFDEFKIYLPKFINQSLNIKKSIKSVKNGNIGLDGRYLNFAPQCSGWHNLTQDGGSGSFLIFWSGFWKLTTASSIPYYTGKYGMSKRGFGYVTIGANIKDFHKDAIETGVLIDKLATISIKTLRVEYDLIIGKVQKLLRDIISEISLITLLMIIFIIMVGIYISDKIVKKLTILTEKTFEYSKGNFDSKIDNIKGTDEISILSKNFNNMADQLETHIKDLNEARKIAEKSEETKSLFLTHMSHEIRTPVYGICGTTDILLNNDHTEEEKIKLYNNLKSSAKSLKHIVGNILDFSKINSDKITIQQKCFNIRNVVEEVYDMFEVSAQEANLMLHYTIEDKISKILVGDPDITKQVLVNMVSNAIKFTRRGSVKIVVSLLNKTDTKNTVIFKIVDQGMGIPKDKCDIIFEPFEQLDPEFEKKSEGTGLGLAICKELVTAMNGEIGVNSELGTGSVFWFKLTFDISESISDDTIKYVDKNIDYSDLKILVVEDNQINMTIIREFFKGLNITIREANCGKEAIIITEKNKFDIIFMDIQMARMNGLDTTKKIRENEKEKGLSQTTIIALTAHVLKEHEQMCYESGMDGYLSKPCEPDDIYKILFEVKQRNIAD